MLYFFIFFYFFDMCFVWSDRVGWGEEQKKKGKGG